MLRHATWSIIDGIFGGDEDAAIRAIDVDAIASIARRSSVRDESELQAEVEAVASPTGEFSASTVQAYMVDGATKRAH